VITTESIPLSAYTTLDDDSYRPSSLTRGPWHPDHQHAGPPIALMCRAIENAALKMGLTHLSRLTANLLRPVPIRDLAIEIITNYSGNGISAILDFARYSFLNLDLTINLLRKPVGEWICVDARTCLGPNGCGLAESMLYDLRGFIGRATQSLVIRAIRRGE
jgi:hypothetical protein